MSVATFNIVNYGDKKIIIDGYKKISDLRYMILERLNIRDKFCKIECLLDTPIRKFGILSINPGELSDIYDNEKINRFNILGKTININVNFCEKNNNKIDLTKLKNMHGSSLKFNDKPKSFEYIDSDFPPLV
jgi:ATP-dependent helicase/DNAse subunit B